VTSSEQSTPAWVTSCLQWLAPRRLRAQAIVLALCLWGVGAADYATPGIFDRAGNIKFQDFLQFPISARLIAQGRTADLYNDQVLADAIRAIVGRDTKVSLQYFYGPQVALPFIPLASLPFLAQAAIWVTLSLLLYFACLYLLWKTCDALRPYAGLIALAALAFPPLFHFFVRGQLSAVVLLCFTLAYLAFRARREWLAGIALGFLVFKPQFLVAIPLLLLLAKAWKSVAGLAISASAQIALTCLYFGPAVMRVYCNVLLHSAGQPTTTELSLSPIQMHSLSAFWELLLPWPPIRLSADSPLLRADLRRRTGQSAPLHLRPAGSGSSVTAPGRLGPNQPAASFHTNAQPAPLSSIHSPDARPALPLDPPPTLSPGIRRDFVPRLPLRRALCNPGSQT
jgi:hypothetical protein